MATATGTPELHMREHEELEIDKIFRQLIKHNGSDLHMQVDMPPLLRLKGTLRELNMEPINKEKMEQLLLPMLDERSKRIFFEDGGADFAHVVEYEGDRWRFRVNLFVQQGHWGMVSRKVERFIPNFAGLNLPASVENLCKYDQGMVLLAGVTGSGKSTSIASMLNWINDNYRKHILTIEDPIEFVFATNKCLINQREVGLDVKDFKEAAQKALAAEGVSMGQWQRMPVPAQGVFQHKRGYGKGCPWTCRFGRDVEYRGEDYPETIKFIDAHSYLPAVYPPNDMELMTSYVKAFQKVFSQPDAWLES